MKITKVIPLADFTLQVFADDGREGLLDVKPYLGYEAFAPLRQAANFMNIRSGGYFVEWECGADLSADTIEARMKLTATADA